MKEKDKVLQALCDGLGENYKLMEIDLELCIYRDFGNRFEVEVSGVHTAKQNKKATIYLWCMDATGAHGYVIKKVGEVPRNKIGKTVEELYEYSENLISQGYDCYEKVQAYLKELVKKEQIGFLNLSMERSYKKDKQYLMKIEKILFKKNQKCSKVI